MARQAPVTIERIERAMDEVALAIDMAGDRGAIYLSIYERLEREAAAFKSQQSAMTRIQLRLKTAAIARGHVL